MGAGSRVLNGIINITRWIISPWLITKVRGFCNRLLWAASTKKIKCIGKKCNVGSGFSIIGPENICIGDNFSAGKNLSLETWAKYQGEETGTVPELNIGNCVTMAANCYISCMDKITIGDGTLLGVNTFICDNYHGRNTPEELAISPSKRKLWSKGPVIIGKNVWTGRNVCIMPGVIVGDGAIIGANSVVTHNVPVGGVAAGSPAKVIRIVETEESV